MLNIGVSGGRGIMGQLICRSVEGNPQTALSGILEAGGHRDEGGLFFGAVVEAEPSAVISRSDVVIDFSMPEATMKVLEESRAQGKALVIGTTGLTTDQEDKVKKAAEEIPVLLSPNMSVGVNLLFKTASELNSALENMGYNKEIIEAHHNRKVDSPSGTAAKLFDIISRDGDKQVNGREGSAGPRTDSEIGVHAVRGGNIVGEHTVMWIGEEDRIELTHRASSRMIFANGAVLAAIWISRSEAGRLYSMKDVLG